MQAPPISKPARPPQSHRLNLRSHLARLTHARPLILRELRAESGRTVNYWLRVLAAAILVLTFATFMLSTDLPPAKLGVMLFRGLNGTLTFALWIIVPLMTADCISREKREGTLGLLFLTPLTVVDIMAGKAAIHILRAATLLLASLPILVLPFMLGGVVVTDVYFAFVAVTNALLMGIAAGIYASARGGTSAQVMATAEFAAFLLWLLSGVCFNIIQLIVFRPASGLLITLSASLASSIILFALTIRSAKMELLKNWNRDLAAPEIPNWTKLFSQSDFWQAVFHWNRGPALDSNPIAWLQEYSWTARLTKWGWFIIILFAELIVVPGRLEFQAWLTAILALGAALSAVSSFRRERQTGMLEILLVTPLSARQLILGRLFGICAHFIPAATVLIACWPASVTLNPREFATGQFAWIIPNPIAFLALIIVGLYVSLLPINFLIGWLITFTLAFLAPAICTVILTRHNANALLTLSITSGYQGFLAIIAWLLLHRNIQQRQFVTHTTN
ncbi:MAG: hypothetical protein JWR69_779 [Pedosphaera sp.]|nr:hypothetical protein [Pedosphaera sp.]